MSDSEQPADLRRKARLQEYQFTSTVPVIGGLIAWLRNAWNSVATKWYVRPLMAQQTAFNLAVVDKLELLQQSVEAGTISLENWLVEEDREHTRLIRQVAELGVRAARLDGHCSRSGAPPATTVRRPLRIAYLSPLPPARSGIADYSAELLPQLSRRADVTLFSDQSGLSHFAGLPVLPAAHFLHNHATFDLALYQMGNSAYHETIYDLLTNFPGVVVLHDYSLHHFIRHHTRDRGDLNGYAREMAYALGAEGRQLARAIQAGEKPPPLFEEPLNERLIDASLGLIVHSEYAAAGIRARRPDVPLAVVPALVEPHAGRSRREALGLPENAVIFGSFGQITAEKQIEPALRAFAVVRAARPDLHYLLVGDVLPDMVADLDALIGATELGECVHRIGHVAELAEFVDYIHTADVVVNLRYPTVGETSAVALRAMAAGRPLVVYDHGWYREIPATAAMKITPLDDDGLREGMDRLASSADLRQKMGIAGRAYAEEFCRPEQVADAYVAFLESVIERFGAAPA